MFADLPLARLTCPSGLALLWPDPKEDGGQCSKLPPPSSESPVTGSAAGLWWGSSAGWRGLRPLSPSCSAWTCPAPAHNVV